MLTQNLHFECAVSTYSQAQKNRKSNKCQHFGLRFISHFYLTLEIGMPFTKVCLNIASGVIYVCCRCCISTPVHPLPLCQLDSSCNLPILTAIIGCYIGFISFGRELYHSQNQEIPKKHLRFSHGTWEKYLGFTENQLEMVQLWVSIYQWICLRKHLYRKASVFPWNRLRVSCQFPANFRG